MADETEEQEEKQEETPEQKASKVDKQYNAEVAFIATVLGSDKAAPFPNMRVAEPDVVATAVAKFFKDRDEKLQDEVYQGLSNLVDTHFKNEAALKEEENKLKQKKTNLRKDFIKVAKAWRGKINQQAVQKQEYAGILKSALEESEKEKDKKE